MPAPTTPTQMSAALGVVLPGGGQAGATEERLAVLRGVRKQFRDPELTTFVCVCTPEFLSLYETERLIQRLMALGMDTSTIIVNQIVPIHHAALDRQGVVAEVEGVLASAGVDSDVRELVKSSVHTCMARAKVQRKYLREIAELYSVSLKEFVWYVC